MISLTVPEEHAQLSTAAQGIQQIADHINETKRRKDLVDMIVSGDNKAESRVGKRIKEIICFRLFFLIAILLLLLLLFSIENVRLFKEKSMWKL